MKLATDKIINIFFVLFSNVNLKSSEIALFQAKQFTVRKVFLSNIPTSKKTGIQYLNTGTNNIFLFDVGPTVGCRS